MKTFTRLAGAAAPLLRTNIDTDTIAPLSREQGTTTYGDLFRALRFREDGSENPDFVLNRPEFRRAGILLAGANFGCGSSREAAVWRLVEHGITCVIAPSFGEIFYGNCFKNGALPVLLDEATIRELADEAGGGASFTVDLEAQTILTPRGRIVSFDVPTFRREQLLNGVDEIEFTRSRDGRIAAFQAADRRRRPWIYLA